MERPGEMDAILWLDKCVNIVWTICVLFRYSYQ